MCFWVIQQTQNGYKLLNLLANQTFVSRDVTFQEHIFPYKSNSHTLYMQPTPTTLSGVPTWTKDFLNIG